jgi:hypothetical protein
MSLASLALPCSSICLHSDGHCHGSRGDLQELPGFVRKYFTELDDELKFVEHEYTSEPQVFTIAFSQTALMCTDKARMRAIAASGNATATASDIAASAVPVAAAPAAPPPPRASHVELAKWIIGVMVTGVLPCCALCHARPLRTPPSYASYNVAKLRHRQPRHGWFEQGQV